MSAGQDTDLTCCVPAGSLPREGISEGPSWQEPRCGQKLGGGRGGEGEGPQSTRVTASGPEGSPQTGCPSPCAWPGGDPQTGWGPGAPVCPRPPPPRAQGWVPDSSSGQQWRQRPWWGRELWVDPRPDPHPPPLSRWPPAVSRRATLRSGDGATRSAVGSSVHEHLPGATRSSWPWAQQGQTRLVTALVESAFWLGVR